MNASRAEDLLRPAASEQVRLDRHLLVGAALREILGKEPIIVGGTAEEFYTADEYHETDLDMRGWLSQEEEVQLGNLGFERRGRHWVHLASKVAVEFPGSRIDGDEARVRHERVAAGEVAIIGLEDLYLDRVRQATSGPTDASISYRSALAIGAAGFDTIDWPYVDAVIRSTIDSDPRLGRSMRDIDRRVRRSIRSKA